MVTPDREQYVADFAERGRYTDISHWDPRFALPLGLTSDDCYLDVDGGGAFTDDEWQELLRLAPKDVAAARLELGLNPELPRALKPERMTEA